MINKNGITLEEVKKSLEGILGGNYKFAVDNCHALLQVHCGMELVKDQGNQFLSRHNGKMYKITNTGFEELMPAKPEPLIVKEKKSFLIELLNKAW